MELTQRLEFTQELYTKCDREKESPEQIGFLGICGNKYPLKKGPNKLGRDPEVCNIVLNLNSVSRQHAVINILNNKDFMLMDLDSANKTKLSDKTLQPYIPHPLKNGDMVQFGEVFGVFRLISEETDLPMTQMMEVPDTPIHNRHISKLNPHAMTIPESPEVSDKEDSLIMTSQCVFKSPSNKFLKSSGNTIAIKAVGTKKIDNVYWSSSKKSDSFSTQINVSDILDDSHTNVNKKSINELDTQITYTNQNEHTDVIYNANTQIQDGSHSPNIYEMDTQIPAMNLSEECNQVINFSTDNKENDNNIYNAETQVTYVNDVIMPAKDNIFNAETQAEDTENVQNKSMLSSSNVSDDIILFDEIDGPELQDNFESQQLLSPKFNIDHHLESAGNVDSQDVHFIPQKRANRIQSDSSTDCEDIYIAPSQNKIGINNDDDNVTDCEDESNSRTNNDKGKSPDIDADVTDCEEFDEVIKPNRVLEYDQFAELPTQVLNGTNVKKDDNIADLDTQIIEEANNIESNQKSNFSDLLTQVLDTEPQKDKSIFNKETIQFKVPYQSPIRKKKKIDTIEIIDDDDEKYYAATQELFDDLCSQRPLCPDEERRSVKDINNTIKPLRILKVSPGRKESPGSSIEIVKFNDFSAISKSSQSQDVIEVENRMSSDGSDFVATPKKVNCESVLEIDLPNTQEIKTGISLIPHSNSESSSDGISETASEKGNRKKNKLKSKIRINLSAKFNPETISVRTRARLRKPTSKMQNCDESFKHTAASIFKSVSVTEQEIKYTKPLKENIDKRGKKKSNRNKSKDSDQSTSCANATGRHSSERNNSKILGIEKYLKREPNTDEKTKKKRESNELNTTMSNKTSIPTDTERTTRRKQRDQNERTESINKKSKSPVMKTEDKIEKQKPSKNKSKSLKLEVKRNPKDSSLEIETKKRKLTESRTKSPEIKNKDSKSIKDKSTEKPNNRKNITKQEVHAVVNSEESKVRRSRRNKSKKSEELLNVTQVKHEQSIVYNSVNITPVSGTDTNKLKRHSTCELDMPNPKKLKSGELKSILRDTPARKAVTQYVLFTAFPSDEVKNKLEKLGAIVISDVKKCTVVLTRQIKRTCNLLCAVGLGKPVVGLNWVQACVDTNTIVDPWLHLLEDEATEKRFNFNLRRTLTGKRDFLRGYNVSSTPNVTPAEREMKLIVECSGGRWAAGAEGARGWACVSSPADRALWGALRRRGARVVSAELVLEGVLAQRLDLKRYTL